MIRRHPEAGKDVITTKPFDSGAGAAWAVLQLAERLGRVVHLNSPAPSRSPELSQIQAWRCF